MKTSVVAAQALKEERAECMWKALEKIIPDVRKRTEVELVATPLTHEFFNRRFKGEIRPVPHSLRAQPCDEENRSMSTCCWPGSIYDFVTPHLKKRLTRTTNTHL